MSNPTDYVLVHGAWHTGECWQRVVPLLTARGHRVFAPSLTGHGDKAHLLGPDVGLDTHVADIVTLITENDLTEAVLVGQSRRRSPPPPPCSPLSAGPRGARSQPTASSYWLYPAMWSPP